MKLWHDDIRRAPDDTLWYWARTNVAAVWFLTEMRMAGLDVPEASLDHDLGLEGEDPDADPMSWNLRGVSPAGDGVDLCMAMYHLRLCPPKITIHSWNPDGADRMASICREAGADVTVNPYRPLRMDDATYAGMFKSWPS